AGAEADTAPVNQTLPAISGTAQVGQTLIETNGSWSPTPTGFSYQWLDCDSLGNNCTPAAANGNLQTYVVASTDLGRTIEVAETAVNGTSAGTTADSL